MAGHTIWGSPFLFVQAGTIQGYVANDDQEALTAQIQINPGSVTYEFVHSPDNAIAMQVVPAMKVESAAIIAEFGDVNSRWTP